MTLGALLHASPLAPHAAVPTCKSAVLPLVAALAGFLVLRLRLLACCACSLASESAPAAWRTLGLPAPGWLHFIKLVHAVLIIILGTCDTPAASFAGMLALPLLPL